MEPTLIRSGKQMDYDSPNYEYRMIGSEAVVSR